MGEWPGIIETLSNVGEVVHPNTNLILLDINSHILGAYVGYHLVVQITFNFLWLWKIGGGVGKIVYTPWIRACNCTCI